MPRASRTKAPTKVSRSKIDLFTQCPRCFFLEYRLGVKRPSMPSFTLNNAVDHLLKKEFDIHRAAQTRHPLVAAYGLKAIPFFHEELDGWRHNFTGVRTVHAPTNLLVFGAIDDLWKDPDTGELIVVDYKATSSDEPVTLEGKWKEGYKRQMEVYQWLLRQNGFPVSDTGYFVYVNGRKDKEAFDAKLEFSVTLLPYTGSDAWVEKALSGIRALLESDAIPPASTECEHCAYRDAAGRAFKHHVETHATQE